MKDGEWKMKVRFVARECKWAENREDMFPLIDFITPKSGLEMVEADAVDAHNQVPEFEEVVVERITGYAWKITNVVWRLRRQLPGRRSVGQSWSVWRGFWWTTGCCERTAPDRLRWNCTWMTPMEWHPRVDESNISKDLPRPDRVQKW